MSCFESMLLKKNSIILTRNKDDYQSASIFKKRGVYSLKKISDLNESLFRKFMSSKKNINNVSKISSYLRRGSFK